MNKARGAGCAPFRVLVVVSDGDASRYIHAMRNTLSALALACPPPRHARRGPSTLHSAHFTMAQRCTHVSRPGQFRKAKSTLPPEVTVLRDGATGRQPTTLILPPWNEELWLSCESVDALSSPSPPTTIVWVDDASAPRPQANRADRSSAFPLFDQPTLQPGIVISQCPATADGRPRPFVNPRRRLASLTARPPCNLPPPTPAPPPNLESAL